jgi:predicted Na+-dependent transporter
MINYSISTMNGELINPVVVPMVGGGLDYCIFGGTQAQASSELMVQQIFQQLIGSQQPA